MEEGAVPQGAGMPVPRGDPKLAWLEAVKGTGEIEEVKSVTSRQRTNQFGDHGALALSVRTNEIRCQFIILARKDEPTLDFRRYRIVLGRRAFGARCVGGYPHANQIVRLTSPRPADSEPGSCARVFVTPSYPVDSYLPTMGCTRCVALYPLAIAVKCSRIGYGTRFRPKSELAVELLEGLVS
jgi:hypothetical protein